MRVRGTLSLLLMAFSIHSLGAAQDDWIEIQSPNFLTISNAHKQASEDFVRQLEQFQAVVAELFGFEAVRSTPLLVVTFRDDRSFTPYKFLVEGKPADVGGFFQRARDFDVIAANVDRRASNPASIIFHEYVHRLTSHGSRRWPSWLSEGIAEFYSSFELDGEDVILGAPIEHHVKLLQEQRLLPLERLLNIDHDSPEYLHSDKKNIFYAESWALVHYLMMAEKGAFRSQLVKFAELIDLDYVPQDAFYRSFDFDVAQLESRLADYVSQNAYYVSRYRLSSQSNKRFEAQPLAQGTAVAYLGDLLRAVGRKEDARTHYKRAISLGDATGRARLGLGILYWEQKDFDSAKTELEAAQRLSPQDPAVSYYLIDIEIRALEKLEGELPAERVAKVFQDLEREIQVQPNLTGQRRLFGELALLSNQHLSEAVDLLDKSLELDPEDDRSRVTLVQVLMAVPDYARAGKELAPLRESPNPEVVEFADSVDRNIEQIQASLKSEGPGNQRAPEDQLPACSPAFLDVRGVPFFQGVLQRVECGPEEVLFVLSVDGVEYTFRDPQPNDPVVFSCGLSKAEMSCGELGFPARIYYQDLGKAGLRALAVELKP